MFVIKIFLNRRKKKHLLTRDLKFKVSVCVCVCGFRKNFGLKFFHFFCFVLVVFVKSKIVLKRTFSLSFIRKFCKFY